MDIKPNGSRPSAQGPAEYFTGSVRFDPLVEAPEPARVRAASVTIKPGARSAWHTPPLGQNLIVTSSRGCVQSRGGPAPVRVYIEELLPDILDGRIESGRVFDRTVSLDEVPAGYRAMDERKELKVLIKP